MKKKLVLLFCIFYILAFTCPVYASNDTVKVVIDGMPVISDAVPYMENGRVLVPIRTITEYVGGTINWVPEENRITGFNGTRSFSLYIGSIEARTTGNVLYTLDTPAKIIGGRTYVPLRFVSEALGCTVNWIDEEKTAYIKSPKINTVKDVAALITPSVVTVETDTSIGSGFIWSGYGEIITNAHVIEGASWVKIKTSDHQEYAAEILIEDGFLDLAKLKIATPEDDFPYIEYFTPLSDLSVGEPVVAIGSSLGLEGTVSSGNISAIRTDFQPMNGLSIIQTTAPISAGNSGGPLLNETGSIIGVNSAGFGEGQNINFAIPIEYVNEMQHRPNDKTWNEFFDLATTFFHWEPLMGQLKDETLSTFNFIQSGDTYSAISLYETSILPNSSMLNDIFANLSYSDAEVALLLRHLQNNVYCMHQYRLHLYNSLVATDFSVKNTEIDLALAFGDNAGSHERAFENLFIELYNRYVGSAE